ncbi:MAG: hypothetical protein ACFE9L_09185 [Candidatus Hodarchaeota archaeon]
MKAEGKGYYCPKCGYWSTILKNELKEIKIIKNGRITITNSKGKFLLYRDPYSPKKDDLLSYLHWEIYIRIER